MLEKENDHGTGVVANINQAHAIIENQQLKTTPKPRTMTDFNYVQILEKNVNNWSKIIFLESWHFTKDKMQ